MMEYIIITDYYDTAGLTDQVRELIAAGWEPLGGVAVSPGDSTQSTVYLQAMIRQPVEKVGE